jgi:hypothetical protein
MEAQDIFEFRMVFQSVHEKGFGGSGDSEDILYAFLAEDIQKGFISGD